jgi:dolichyl-phosphate-mannose--protein O-mannosyl transferase
MVSHKKKKIETDSKHPRIENGLIANNRLILLDPPLLFFTSITTLAWTYFFNQKRRPFQFWWYFWLAATGAGLGLTVSCKWVGLFTIATIGTSTVKNLWELWGNTRISKVRTTCIRGDGWTDSFISMNSMFL